MTFATLCIVIRQFIVLHSIAWRKKKQVNSSAFVTLSNDVEYLEQSEEQNIYDVYLITLIEPNVKRL